MRKVIFLAIAVLTVVFVVARWDEIVRILETIQNASPQWLLLGAFLQAAWLLNVAGSLRTIYRLLGMDEQIDHLFQVAAAAHFIGTITPSMGMGGMAVFVVDGQRRGRPSSRVTTGVTLYILYDYLAFLVVLTLGLVILLRHGQLHWGAALASLIFACAALVLSALILAGMRSTDQLRGLLVWLGSKANRMLRLVTDHDYFNIDRARTFANDVGEGLQQVRGAGGALVYPAILAMSNKAVLISILYTVLVAFGQTTHISTLIAAFSIGYLFQIVSPTPSGLGFVEGAMTLGLNSLGVPFGAAAVVAITYRGLTFWLPLLYGMLAFRLVGRGQPAFPD